MKAKHLAAFSAVLAAALCGCQSLQMSSGAGGEVVNAGYESTRDGVCHRNYNNTYYCDDSGGCCRREPDKCGLTGVACCLGKETCALFHCLTSYRWQGGYPNGALHGWRGSWCGPCGEGCLDMTQPPCEAP